MSQAAAVEGASGAALVALEVPRTFAATSTVAAPSPAMVGAVAVAAAAGAVVVGVGAAASVSIAAAAVEFAHVVIVTRLVKS